MKQLKSFTLLFLLILGSCSNSNNYHIEKEHKSIIDNDNCSIEFDYPQFISTNPILKVDKLNHLLEIYVDYKYHTQRCDEAQKEKRLIKGEYKVLLETDDRLSIEFLTIHYSGSKSDTVYQSLAINPQKIGDEVSDFLLTPEVLFPNFDRKKLYKSVKQFSETNKKHINLLAYETGSNYVITWGLTETSFVLYVGGEGEWFGYDKIEIPLEELR